MFCPYLLQLMKCTHSGEDSGVRLDISSGVGTMQNTSIIKKEQIKRITNKTA